MGYIRPNRQMIRNAGIAVRRVATRNQAMGTDMTDQEFRAASIAELKQINVRTDEAAREERFQKWVQIGVTAAIPVFAGVWKIIGRVLSRDT